MTVLSASSVKTYEDCHLQWYFEYVEMREQPSNEPKEVGIIVHDHAEATLKGDEVSLLTIAKTMQNPAVLHLFNLFDEAVLPTYGNVLLVEAAFELDVEGVTYTGFIDAVAEGVQEHMLGSTVDFDEGPAVILRDLKTTGSRPRPDRFRDNMTGYHLGARELGHEPTHWLLDYLVRTKKPYYWPEWQSPVDDDEVDVWAAKVVRVHNSIEEGDWEATGIGTYVCNYCPFKDICGPYERYQELTSPIRKDAR